MKKEFLQCIVLVCSVLGLFFVSDSYAQGGRGEGSIYFKDGSVQKGEICFKKTKLFIKKKGTSKKRKVDPATVSSFEHYEPDFTKKYVFALTDFSAMHKRKYYIYSLIKDGKRAQIYGDIKEISHVSNSIHFSKKITLFIHKTGKPYAQWVQKSHSNFKDRLEEIFEDCPDLVAKMETDKKYINVQDAVTYYNTSCGK